jgi:hypothetical protein
MADLSPHRGTEFHDSSTVSKGLHQVNHGQRGKRRARGWIVAATAAEQIADAGNPIRLTIPAGLTKMRPPIAVAIQACSISGGVSPPCQHEVGLDGTNAAEDIRDLRSLLAGFRLAKQTAVQTAVRLITTGILLAALMAGIAVKLKLFGSTP